MIPGICFRRSWKSELLFSTRKTILPPTTECISFYDGLNCKGASISLGKTGNHAEALNRAATMALC